jgi:hypothetical protein
MKIKSFITILFLLATCSIFAKDVAKQDATTQDLKATANAPEIKKELSQPDGAAIFLKDDGSFQILARGTGSYDIADIDNINDARQEATLKAKAALVKFVSEKLSTEESFTSTSKKVKTITTNGQTENAKIDDQRSKEHSTTIKNSAESIVKAIIVLKEEKVPHKNSSGEIQVTVGVSSKTIKAVDKLLEATNKKNKKANSKTANKQKYQVKNALTDF